MGPLNAKGRVLVWHDIIFIVGIEWLMLRRDINFLGGQFDACKVLEQMGVVGGVEMEMGKGGIARLVI